MIFFFLLLDFFKQYHQQFTLLRMLMDLDSHTLALGNLQDNIHGKKGMRVNKLQFCNL